MSRKRTLLIAAALAVVFVISSWWTQGGGLMLYGEADWFLIDHNTDQRSLASKLICPHQNDATQYLARETTHVVEHIDATFIHWCCVHGCPHFQSICTYFFLSAIGLLVIRAMLISGTNPWITLLCGAAYWSSSSIFLAGNYVRPGHAHAAFWLTCLCCYLYEGKTDWVWRFPCVFLLALMTTWADRQGMVLCGVTILVLLAMRREAAAHDCIAVGSGILVHIVWALTLGPAMITMLTPFSPTSDYQGDVAHNFISTIAKNFPEACRLITSNWCKLLGNVPTVFGVGAIAIVCGLQKKWWVPAGVVASLIVMQSLVMFHASSVVWPDMIAVSYYNIPVVTVLFLLLAAASHRFRFGATGVTCILVACVISNLVSLPTYISSFRNGHLAGFILGAPHIRTAIRELAHFPTGPSTNRWNAVESMTWTGFQHCMKNPLERQMTIQEFVESSNYLQFLRGEKGWQFGKGGR